jgi:hypothetical protein
VLTRPSPVSNNGDGEGDGGGGGGEGGGEGGGGVVASVLIVQYL